MLLLVNSRAPISNLYSTLGQFQHAFQNDISIARRQYAAITCHLKFAEGNKTEGNQRNQNPLFCGLGNCKIEIIEN